jgi:hypothetical protein
MRMARTVAVGWLGIGFGLVFGCLTGWGADAATSGKAVGGLKEWLGKPREERGAIAEQEFASVALTAADSVVAADALWVDRKEWIRATRRAETEARQIEIGGKVLRYEVVRFADAAPVPAGGRSLFISMHGGGGAPKRVNDSQWTNQVRLARQYAPKEGIYVAPRAPTDTWNLWHEEHIDALFARLIENMVVLEDVNPDRVYLMGYSAGGDGVYQLAPRMADWFGAAAMSAGHPNETQPLGLRNLPFALHVGSKDSAYRRNEIAVEWREKLARLRDQDPGGYEHLVGTPDTGHWMGMADRVAIPWMEERTRRVWPDRVAWRQDDVLHGSFYWLAVPAGTARAGVEVIARREGAVVLVEKSETHRLLVRWTDGMTDLEGPVEVRMGDKVLHRGVVTRTVGTLARTLEERGDRKLMFPAEIEVTVP